MRRAKRRQATAEGIRYTPLWAGMTEESLRRYAREQEALGNEAIVIRPNNRQEFLRLSKIVPRLNDVSINIFLLSPVV